MLEEKSLHQAGELLGKSTLGRQGCQGSQRQQLGICYRLFSLLKSLMCLNPSSGKRRINLRSFLLVFGRKWVPRWEHRAAQSPCPGVSDVFGDAGGSQLKGFVPSQSCFFLGTLFWSLICCSRAEAPFPQVPNRCNTPVSFASSSCALLGLSVNPFKALEFVCVLTLQEKRFNFSFFGDGSC